MSETKDVARAPWTRFGRHAAVRRAMAEVGGRKEEQTRARGTWNQAIRRAADGRCRNHAWKVQARRIRRVRVRCARAIAMDDLCGNVCPCPRRARASVATFTSVSSLPIHTRPSRSTLPKAPFLRLVARLFVRNDGRVPFCAVLQLLPLRHCSLRRPRARAPRGLPRRGRKGTTKGRCFGFDWTSDPFRMGHVTGWKGGRR